MNNEETLLPMFIPYDIISNLPRKEAVVLTKIFVIGINVGYTKASNEFISSIISGSTPDEINDIIDDLSRRNTLTRYYNSNNHQVLLINSDVFDIYKNTVFYKKAVDQSIPSGYTVIENGNKNFDGLVIPSEIKLSIDYRYIPLLAIIVVNSESDGYIRMDNLVSIAAKFHIDDLKLTLKELSINKTIDCYIKEGDVALISPSSWTRTVYDQCDVHLSEFMIPDGFTLFTKGIENASIPEVLDSTRAHFKDNLMIPTEIQNEIDYKYWVPFVQFIRTTESTGTGHLNAIIKLLHGFTDDDSIAMFKYLYENGYVNIYSKFYDDYKRYSFSIVLKDKIEYIYNNYYDLYVHKPKLSNTTYDQIDLSTFLKESKGEY